MQQRLRRSAFTFGLALALCVPAFGDGQKVTIRLRDGRSLEGELLDGGSRQYRVKVGKNIVTVEEHDVLELTFAKAPAPSLDAFASTPPALQTMEILDPPTRATRSEEDAQTWAALVKERLGGLKSERLINPLDPEAVDQVVYLGLLPTQIDPCADALFRAFGGMRNASTRIAAPRFGTVRIAALRFGTTTDASRYVDGVVRTLGQPDTDPIQLGQRTLPSRIGDLTIVALTQAESLVVAIVDSGGSNAPVEHDRRELLQWARAQMGLPPLAATQTLASLETWNRRDNRGAKLHIDRLIEQLRDAPSGSVNSFAASVPLALDEATVCMVPIGASPQLRTPDLFHSLLDTVESGVPSKPLSAALRRAFTSDGKAENDATKQRTAAMRCLLTIGRLPEPKQVLSRLVVMLEKGTDTDRELAAVLLESHGDPSLVPLLLDLVEDPTMPGTALARLLYTFGDASMRPRIIALLDNPRLRFRAFQPLVRCGTRADHALVLAHAKAFYTEGRRVSKEKGEAIAGLGELLILDALADRLWNPALNVQCVPLLQDKYFAEGVARQLETHGTKELVPHLRKLIDDPVAGKYAKRLIEHIENTTH